MEAAVATTALRSSSVLRRMDISSGRHPPAGRSALENLSEELAVVDVHLEGEIASAPLRDAVLHNI